MLAQQAFLDLTVSALEIVAAHKFYRQLQSEVKFFIAREEMVRQYRAFINLNGFLKKVHSRCLDDPNNGVWEVRGKEVPVVKKLSKYQQAANNKSTSTTTLESPKLKST